MKRKNYLLLHFPCGEFVRPFAQFYGMFDIINDLIENLLKLIKNLLIVKQFIHFTNKLVEISFFLWNLNFLIGIFASSVKFFDFTGKLVNIRVSFVLMYLLNFAGTSEVYPVGL